MKQELTTDDFIASQLKQFNVTDNAIQALKDDYFKLEINGIEDKEGYNVVKAARLHVRSFRTELEEKRKELVENPLRIKRAIDEEARRRREQLEEIEAHLKEKELEYEIEVKRLKDEQERLEKERARELEMRTQKRIQQLYLNGFQFNGAIYQAVYIKHISEYSLNFIKDSDDKKWEDSFNLDVVRFEEFKKQREEKALVEAAEKRLAEIEKQRVENERRALAEIEAAKLRQEEIEKQRQKEYELEEKEQELQAEKNRIALEKQRLEDDAKAMKAAQLEVAKQNERLKLENEKLIETQKKLKGAKIKKNKLEENLIPLNDLYQQCLNEYQETVGMSFNDVKLWEDRVIIFGIFTKKCSESCLDLEFKEAALKLVEK